MRKQIRKNNLTQEFVEAFAEAIVQGEYAIGDFIPSEAEIADEFGISRTVVREGVRELSALGLIAKRQGARSTVAPKDNWDILSKTLLIVMLNSPEMRGEVMQGLFGIRLSLECHAAAEAAARRTGEDLAVMHEQLALMEDAIHDQERFVEVDHKMHCCILDAVHNMVFSSILRTVHDSLKIARTFMVVDSDSQNQAIQHHRDLVRHIEKRDSAAAAKAMQDHIVWAKEQSENKPHGVGSKNRPAGQAPAKARQWVAR